MVNKVLGALAPVFNALLGIQPGAFGHARRATEPSPANLRAAARLSATLEKNRERLKAVPLNTVKSRQVLRAEDRRWQKSLLSDLKAKTRSRRGNGAAVTRLP
jgi:hypothetical protein